jgi:drug/metabolite transporter (DMT)-like permease
MVKYIVIIISTFLSALAQYFLKVGVLQFNIVLNQKKTNFFVILKSVFSNFYIIGGFLVYVLGAVLWLYVLLKFELSKAYPFASLGYIFTLIIGYFFLNEAINFTKVIAIFLIVVGVIVMSYAR